MYQSLNKVFTALNIFILAGSASQAFSQVSSDSPIQTQSDRRLLWISPAEKEVSEDDYIDRIVTQVASSHAKIAAFNTNTLLLQQTSTPATSIASKNKAQSSAPSEEDAQLLDDIRQLKEQIASLKAQLKDDQEQIPLGNSETTPPYPQEGSVSFSSNTNQKKGFQSNQPVHKPSSVEHQAQETNRTSSFTRYSSSDTSYDTLSPSSYDRYEESSLKDTSHGDVSTDVLKIKKRKLNRELSQLKKQQADNKQTEAGDEFSERTPNIPTLFPSRTRTITQNSKPARSEKPVKQSTRPTSHPISNAEPELKQPSLSSVDLVILLLDIISNPNEDKELRLRQIKRFEQQVSINWLQPLLPYETQANLLLPNGEILKIEDSVPFALMVKYIHLLPQNIVDFILQRIRGLGFQAWATGYKVGPIHPKKYIWYSPLGDILYKIRENKNNPETVSRLTGLAFRLIIFQSETIHLKHPSLNQKERNKQVNNTFVAHPKTPVSSAAAKSRDMLDVQSTINFLINTLNVNIEGIPPQQIAQVGEIITTMQKTGLALDIDPLTSTRIAAAHAQVQNQITLDNTIPKAPPPPPPPPLLPPPPSITDLTSNAIAGIVRQRNNNRVNSGASKDPQAELKAMFETNKKFQFKKTSRNRDITGGTTSNDSDTPELTSEELLAKIEAEQEIRKKKIKEENEIQFLKDIRKRRKSESSSNLDSLTDITNSGLIDKQANSDINSKIEAAQKIRRKEREAELENPLLKDIRKKFEFRNTLDPDSEMVTQVPDPTEFQPEDDLGSKIDAALAARKKEQEPDRPALIPLKYPVNHLINEQLSEEDQKIKEFIADIDYIDPDFSSIAEYALIDWTKAGHTVESAIAGLMPWITTEIDLGNFIFDQLEFEENLSVDEADQYYQDLETLNIKLLGMGYSAELLYRVNQLIINFTTNPSDEKKNILSVDLDKLLAPDDQLSNIQRSIVARKEITITIKKITDIEIMIKTESIKASISDFNKATTREKIELQDEINTLQSHSIQLQGDITDLRVHDTDLDTIQNDLEIRIKNIRKKPISGVLTRPLSKEEAIRLQEELNRLLEEIKSTGIDDIIVNLKMRLANSRKVGNAINKLLKKSTFYQKIIILEEEVIKLSEETTTLENEITEIKNKTNVLHKKIIEFKKIATGKKQKSPETKTNTLDQSVFKDRINDFLLNIPAQQTNDDKKDNEDEDSDWDEE